MATNTTNTAPALPAAAPAQRLLLQRVDYQPAFVSANTAGPEQATAEPQASSSSVPSIVGPFLPPALLKKMRGKNLARRLPVLNGQVFTSPLPLRTHNVDLEMRPPRRRRRSGARSASRRSDDVVPLDMDPRRYADVVLSARPRLDDGALGEVHSMDLHIDPADELVKRLAHEGLHKRQAVFIACSFFAFGRSHSATAAFVVCRAETPMDGEAVV